MIDRRDFLKLAATLSATFGVEGMPTPVMAALKKINPANVPKLIYLQGLSCTGCSISLLQAESPSPLKKTKKKTKQTKTKKQTKTTFWVCRSSKAKFLA